MPLIVLATLLLAGVAVASERPNAADGTPFPEAVAERKFSATIPIVGTRMGAMPEELQARVFSTEASRTMIERQSLPNPIEWWFAIGVNGARTLDIGLDRGRVVRLRYRFDDRTERSLRGLRAQLGRFGGASDDQWERLTFRTDGGRVYIENGPTQQGGARTLTVRIDSVDWYLLHESPAEEVAAAMRAGHIVKGMKLEEAKLILGEPRETRDDGDATWVLWIEERSTVTSFGSPRSLPQAGTAVSREMRVQFVDGVCVVVDDRRIQ